MHVLELEGLSKSFRSDWTFRRTPVVQDLSLQVEPGEVFGFLGPNGAGKTTTIKMIVDLIRPDAGALRIFGLPASDPRSRERLGFLPETTHFYDYLTGREFLLFCARFVRFDRGQRRRRVDEMLERTGIAAAADRPLRKYSKGMQQRLGLAQALLGDPDLVILDEPMSGLDPVGRREVRDLILDLRERGKTVFFSSHILQDAEMLCDRVAILDKGRLRSQGRLEELVGERISAWEVTLEGADRAEGDPSAGLPGKLLSRRGREVLRRVDSEEELQLLLRSAERAGVRLLSLVPQRETLEEVFLREIGEAPEPAAAGR